MHILLTDILTCPRCGPAFGLILLANRIEERRVLDGVLGCSNCREQYRIADGAAELGGGAALPIPVQDEESAIRLAALLGVTGSGFILLAGPAAAHGPALAEMLPGAEIMVASHGEASGNAGAGYEALSRLGLGGRSVPIASGRLAAVALTGGTAEALLEDAARALSPVGRLVLEPIPSDAEERLERTGLRVLVRDARTLVAGTVAMSRSHV